ncbi:MAG TPA: DinB family protein [Thermoanaerobaculia bacterium]|nr:DinB family protein [Thermoanaerobaculia bacterium]
MDLRPEQHRALDYARRKGSESSVDSIRKRVTATFADLEALLDSVRADEASRSPAPSRWSVHQVVDHLVVTHRAAVEELRSLVAGVAPESGPIPASLVSDDPFATEWRELVADLRIVHRDFVAVLHTATDATPREVRAPVVMVVKCENADGLLEPVEWMDRFDWKAYAILFRAHTLEHAQQIQRTLETVRASGNR